MRKKLNIFVMDRDSAHLQSIRKSVKRLKLKGTTVTDNIKLSMFQTEDAILAAIKKVLDGLTIPSSSSDEFVGTNGASNQIDSPLFSRNLSPHNSPLGLGAKNQSPIARGKERRGCLNPIQLILFELKAGTPDDGWNLHETVKQMYA